MAPKHSLAGLVKEREGGSKRAKSSAQSRSVTPAVDSNARVPFKVEYPEMEKRNLTKEEKALAAGAEKQVSPFVAKGANAQSELDQYYTVTPRKEWDSMKKYNNFIIQGETYKNDQIVYVRGESTPDNKDVDGKDKDFWVARVLQVRAKDQQHVYALVAWLYWPEELPPPATRSPDQVNKFSGRRKYHGSHELIASNYMEVLDVLSFAGKAEVLHWDEQSDNLTHKLYWRQTYSRETQALSKLRTHCVCDGYFNPEVEMFVCDNPKCGVWLHSECLEKDILEKTYDKLVDGSNGVVSSTDGKSAKSAAPKWKGKFRVTIPKTTGAPKAQIIDLRVKASTKTWSEDITCPKCDTVLQ